MKLPAQRRVALIAAVALSLGIAVAHARAARAAPTAAPQGVTPEANAASRRPPVVLGRALAIDRSGRIVVAGTINYHFALARYRPNGRPDTSFGDGGAVTTNFGASGGLGIAQAVAIDPSGRIVAVGDRGASLAVARYRPNGTLDRSFGGSGTVKTRIAEEDDAAGVAIDPSGRIVVTATACFLTNCGDSALVLARYRRDGTLDPSFGSGGRGTILDPASFAGGVAIDAQGRIVAAGGSPVGYSEVPNFLLARYNAAGSLDATFGGGGRVRTTFAGPSAADAAVALEPTGLIVAAGGCNCTEPSFALARYGADGALDTSFGDGGRVTTGFGYAVRATDAAVDIAGKIVVSGYGHGAFALARYAQTGSLDPTFGSGGLVTTAFPPGEGAAYALAIDSAGRIVVAGDRRPRGAAGNTSRELILARFRPSGVLDPRFGRGGRVITSFVPNTVIASARIDAKLRRARFTFKSAGQSTGVQCALASRRHRKPRFTGCRSPKTYKRLRPGRYTFAVRARGAAGPDPTPAKRRFTIPAPRGPR